MKRWELALLSIANLLHSTSKKTTTTMMNPTPSPTMAAQVRVTHEISKCKKQIDASVRFVFVVRNETKVQNRRKKTRIVNLHLCPDFQD